MALLEPELVYREAEWEPHGLMCVECPHAMVQIVCVGCALL